MASDEPDDTAEPAGEGSGAAAPEAAERPARGPLLVVAAILALGGAAALAAALAMSGGDDAPRQEATPMEAAAPEPDAAEDPDAAADGTTDEETAVLGNETAGDATAGGWPAEVIGRPAGLGELGTPPPPEPFLGDGWYVWLDFDGWHAWLVGGDGQDTSLALTSDDAVAKAEPLGGPAEVVAVDNRVEVRRGGATERVVGAEVNPGFFAKTVVITVTGDVPLHVGASATAVPRFYGVRALGT